MKKLSGKLSKKAIIPLLVVLILIIAAGGAVYYKLVLTKKAATPQAQISDLVTSVGKLIELPSETPTVATVSDISKLKDQPFFAKAVNGDKVLIYQNSKKAILFRPSENKIIEVAVYNPPQGAATSSAATSTTQNINVSIYNGTKTAGLAKTQGNSISSKYPIVKVVSTGNASGEYKKTLVVDLSGNNKDFAKTLATYLNGEVGSLPSGEVNPTGSDILVIIGQ